MDSTGTGAPGSPPQPTGLPDLRTEVVGTVVLFVLTVLVTAGVALVAHLLVGAVG